LSSEYTGFEIAIIGMSGRFPGSKNVKELWNNLCKGKNLISYFSDEELLENGIPEEYVKDTSYVKARGIIDDVDKFDAELFGFYPKEIENLDPQQRLFLECTWEALENAGYQPDDIKGLTGVFGGIGMNTYVLQFLKSNPELVTSAEGYQFSIGNEKDFLTTRVSYKLNLKGPSFDVQTACSTSLVATHIACMNLLNFQCDVAIAGGSTISLPQKNGYHYQEGMILSPDGVCRPFDKDAGGTVASNGVGIVVLKRLEDAINDKDDIYAVIKGSAYNNDGAIKVGYTAPGVNGQTEVITSAYGMAEVPMSSIGYIETHGTGTSLGDPIEIDALTQAFKQEGDKKQFCAIGSVKSNVGHLDTAAGVTGLIKAALAVYHGKIPPSINYKEQNPKINFEETPFYVNTKLIEWETDGSPRRAGVSSFGIGGTNVHVVLEQAPKRISDELSDDYKIIPFSAKTKTSLKNLNEKFVDFLNENSATNFNSLAFTLQLGRKEFENRQFIVAKNVEELKSILNGEVKKKLFKNNSNLIESPSVVFMFSGQGSQYVNMCKDLYETEDNFRKYVDECFDILKDEQNINLKEIIYPTDVNDEASEKLKQTEYTQPALFVIEYSLAKMFIDFGIVPQKMVGHSIGEFVAACIAGVMDLKSALKLVTARGALMQKVEKGTMLSVTLPENELKEILPDDLDLAVINAPELCVVSGKTEKINSFEKVLTEKEISSAFLHTSHAFHSSMMEPVLDEFKTIVENIKLNSPTIPYMSNVTGGFISDEDAVNPNYYVNHLRYTVRFAENITNLLDDKNNVLLEVGPGSTLASLAKLNHKADGRTIINSARHPHQSQNDKEILLNAIGHLWLSGVNIDWNKFYKTQPSRIHLPTYAFDKKRYWIKVKASKKANKFRNSANINNWFYEISWKRKSLSENKNEDIENTYLLFDDKNNSLDKILNNQKRTIIKVYQGNEFKEVDDLTYQLSTTSVNDYEKLFEKLSKKKLLPNRIVHNWSNIKIGNGKDELKNYIDNGLLSLVNISKAILDKNIESDIHIDIITSNVFDVVGNENIIAGKSTILGAAKVIQQEIKNISTKIIDVDAINDKLKIELLNQKNEVAVALRGNYRWTQEFEELDLSKNTNVIVKPNGVYIITGGLGRIGLVFAEYFAKEYDANIVLLDRFDIPSKNEWGKYISAKNEKDNLYPRIKKLIELNKNTGEISVLKTDVSNEEELKEAIDSTVKKYGKINGVIHAAGLVGEETAQLINNFDYHNLEKQIQSKVTGAINLSKVLENIDVDFVLMQSSLSSMLGGLGFASYSAVNNFIDALIIHKSKENNKTKWMTVNWDGWNFGNSKNKGITPEKGIEVLKKVLTQNVPSQIVVSIENIHESIDKWLLSAKKEKNEEVADEENGFHERPDLETEYVEASSDMEKQVLDEWKKLLGIEKIGINDNFFDLGGDSLIGTQLVSRMRKTFNVDIPLVAVFENATIKGIANLIEKHSVDKSKTEDIADVLSELENLSEDEILKKLKDRELE
jgi:acyl transferase domain-containing protein/acyl carrier protein